MFKSSFLLLFAIIWWSSQAQLLITQRNDTTSYYMTLLTNDTAPQINWTLVRVAKLPGGVQLPDFYYTFMDIVEDINFCAPPKRILQTMPTADQITQIKSMAAPLLADPAAVAAINKGEDPIGLSAENQQLYSTLKMMCQMQGITMQAAFAMIQSQEQTQVPTTPVAPVPSPTVPDAVVPTQSLPTPVVPTPGQTTVVDPYPSNQPFLPVVNPVTPVVVPSYSFGSFVTESQASVVKQIADYTARQKDLKFNIDQTLSGYAQSEGLSVDSKESLTNVIGKDLSKRLQYLQQGTSTDEMEQKQKMVEMFNTDQKTMRIVKDTITPGYAYFFQANVDGKIVETTLAPSLRSPYDDVIELTNFANYLNLPNQCIRHCRQYTMSYDLRNSPQLQRKSINRIEVEMAPFFQFSNSDACVESVGWRVRFDVPQAVTLVAQTFNFTIPFTAEDTLAAYVQFIIHTDDGLRFVGFQRFTVKGMSIEIGQIMKQINSNQDLRQISQLTSQTNMSQSTLSLANMDTASIMNLVQMFTSVTNVQGQGYEALASKVLNNCGDSFSWMVQKLKSQFNNVSTQTPPCGSQICQQGRCSVSTNTCVCNSGYSGAGCQYTFEEYQQLAQAQNHLLSTVIKNNKTDQMAFNDVISQVQMVSSQQITNEESVDNLEKLVNISVTKMNSPSQIPQLLEAVRGLKNNYQHININETERSKKLTEIGVIASNGVKQLAKNIKQQFTFATPDFAGISTLSPSYIRPSSTSPTLDGFGFYRLGTHRFHRDWRRYQKLLHRPNCSVPRYSNNHVTSLGVQDFKIAKSVMFYLQQCAYQGMKNCLSPVVTVSLLDVNGTEMPQTMKSGQHFTVQIPLAKGVGTNLQCGWLDDKNQVQTGGCVRTGIDQTSMFCNCTHLTRFMALAGDTTTTTDPTSSAGGQPGLTPTQETLDQSGTNTGTAKPQSSNESILMVSMLLIMFIMI